MLETKAFSGPFVLLEDGRERGCARLYANPRAILRADSPHDVLSALDAAEDARRSGCHIAGYLAYEAGYLLEPKLAALFHKADGTPLVWLGVFERSQALDTRESDSVLSAAGRAHAGPLEYEWNAGDYKRGFDRLHEWISAGDLYQANLTFRARFNFTGDPRSLYRDLRRYSRAAHCAFIDDGERYILSLSPELFFEIAPDGSIFAKPMKGTAPRGANADEDILLRDRLLASDKERAENLMIVDLMRNDLSRLAEAGSVAVDRLFEIESYPTLHQMVSTVRARLKPHLRVPDVIRALFPCGSVTGAPKFRAMQAIRKLESSPRGIYCGAIGAFHPDGSARFNVAIRTLTISGRRGELGIGGGVVFDSSGGAEYEECLLKAKHFERARSPLELIETLRWSPGEGFVRWERHLTRMGRSAAVFGIPFRKETARDELGRAVAGCTQAQRVRLVLFEGGRCAATRMPFGVENPAEWRFVFSPLRVQSTDVLLRHKTNCRRLFDSEHRRASEKLGAEEVLFFNERGEVTEGSRTNVFVRRGGMLETPALSCGLLEGCLRGELLDSGRCVESVLRPEDLAHATAVFLGNSLRGLIRARQHSIAVTA